MTSDQARYYTAIQKLIAQQGKMETGFTRVGRAGQRAGKNVGEAFGGQAASQLKSYVTGLLSVSGTIGIINKAYATWMTNIRETGAEANKAANELIAFAALQEGGTKGARVKEAMALARKHGITQRGEAFNTVQALQSALGGDFKAGMKAAGTVFAATQVGIPLEAGREAEVVGAATGQVPGQALRRAYVAGQLSSRDPALLAKAGRAMRWNTQPLPAGLLY